jgi:hypothetical protein
MANFCTLVEKNTSPKHLNDNPVSKTSWCEDFDAGITFEQNGSFGMVMSVQQVCIIFSR